MGCSIRSVQQQASSECESAGAGVQQRPERSISMPTPKNKHQRGPRHSNLEEAGGIERAMGELQFRCCEYLTATRWGVRDKNMLPCEISIPADGGYMRNIRWEFKECAQAVT